MNSRVGTTFRVIRGTGGVGTLGRGTSLGDGLGDSVGGSGVVLGGRITHFLLRLCHATSKSAARLRVTGFLIKVKGRGIFDKGDTTLGGEEGNTAIGEQLGVSGKNITLLAAPKCRRAVPQRGELLQESSKISKLNLSINCPNFEINAEP